MNSTETLRLRQLLDADWRRLLEVSGEPPRPRKFSTSFSPRFASVVLIRIAQRASAKRWSLLAKLASLINFLLFGIEVPARLAIGPGLVLPHPQGVVLGAGHVGSNVTIFHQVTLGAKVPDFGYDIAKRPYVCDGVFISVGAKILGPVRLGERAVIGANAVVLQDVPPDSTAVGVPARIVANQEPADAARIS